MFFDKLIRARHGRYQAGLGIRHRVSRDNGKSWSDPTVVLSMNASVTPTPGGKRPAPLTFPSLKQGQFLQLSVLRKDG